MTGNIPSSSNGKTDEETVIEDVEDIVDELPGSYISKSTARLFDKIHNGKDGFLPSSKFVVLVETLGVGG